MKNTTKIKRDKFQIEEETEEEYTIKVDIDHDHEFKSAEDFIEYVSTLSDDEIKDLYERIQNSFKVSAEHIQEFRQGYIQAHKDLAKQLELDVSELDEEELIRKVDEKLDDLEKSEAQGVVENVYRNALPIKKEYGLMNDKVSNNLTNGVVKMDGQFSFELGQGGDCTTTIALTYEGDDIKFNKKLSGFDIAVYDAISTEHYYYKLNKPNEPLYITPDEICRSVFGKKDPKYKPHKKQIEKVAKSMDKMRFTKVTMDISDEIKKRKLTIDDERIVNGEIDTYLLTAEKVSFTTDRGKVLTGYKVVTEPILYTYNEAKGHILFFDYNLLDIDASITVNLVEFRNYLLKQILMMKNGHRNSNIILYDTLYTDSGAVRPEERIDREAIKDEANYKTRLRKESKADRDRVASILNTWITDGWITGFDEIREGTGHQITKIKINFAENKHLLVAK